MRVVIIGSGQDFLTEYIWRNIMKKLHLPGVLLAIFAMAGITPASFAGGERWIMAMTSERMVQEQLIHVRFLSPDNVALESDALKQMVIREQDCSSGHAFEMARDYKMGFALENKLVGIYLYPQVWKNKPLCFSVPGLGKVEKSLTAADNAGHSIQLNVAP